jgi:hypothetical protein
VAIGQQEFRCDLALNYWGLGISMHETGDWSIHLGPMDIECGYGKLCDMDEEWIESAYIRLLSKARVTWDCELDDIDHPTEG